MPQWYRSLSDAKLGQKTTWNQTNVCYEIDERKEKRMSVICGTCQGHGRDTTSSRGLFPFVGIHGCVSKWTT